MKDQELAAAVLMFGPVRGHELLGCDWGTRIALPDDGEVCIRQARQPVVLHGPAGASRYKLCRRHMRVVERETDPHAGAVSA